MFVYYIFDEPLLYLQQFYCENPILFNKLHYPLYKDILPIFELLKIITIDIFEKQLVILLF